MKFESLTSVLWGSKGNQVSGFVFYSVDFVFTECNSSNI